MSKLIKWIPLLELENNLLQVESIVDDYNGINIILKEYNSKSIIEIRFEDNLSYRNTNESFLLKKIYENDLEYNGHSLFMIDNSLFIKEFHENSLKIYKEWDIKHYYISTPQDCIDILSIVPPIIEWQK